MSNPKRKATITFKMKDRSEHIFVVSGTGQKEWIAQGELLLARRIIKTNKQGTTGAVIETFQTKPHDKKVGKTKDDGIAIRSALQKVRVDLLPNAALVEVARVFTFGAANYGDQNWREGFAYSRCRGAAKRHAMKHDMGQDCDTESGCNELAHEIANLLFMLEFQLTGTGTDDRIKYPQTLIDKLFAPYVNEMPLTPIKKGCRKDVAKR